MKKSMMFAAAVLLGSGLVYTGVLWAQEQIFQEKVRDAGAYLERMEREDDLRRMRSNPLIDFPGFLEVSEEVFDYRNARRIEVDTFLEMARDPDTIILDTRSKDKYELIHITGARHLNFSDFTEESLAKVIPSKDTRVLIYCNNNFFTGNDSAEGTFRRGFTTKSPNLALNIPTFINLYGYGYKNIYELKPAVNVRDTEIPFTRSDLAAGKEKR